MTNPGIEPPPIPPTTFYKSVRTYRTMRTFTLIATGLLFGVPFTSGVISHLTHQPTGDLPVPFLYIGSAFFLFGAYVLISNSVRNVQEQIEINSEGIRSKHNFWYWSQVQSIKPKKVNFATKYFIHIGLRVDPRAHVLQPDKPLTAIQYDDFIDRVRPFIEAQHPTIQLKSPPW